MPSLVATTSASARTTFVRTQSARTKIQLQLCVQQSTSIVQEDLHTKKTNTSIWEKVVFKNENVSFVQMHSSLLKHLKHPIKTKINVPQSFV